MKLLLIACLLLAAGTMEAFHIKKVINQFDVPVTISYGLEHFTIDPGTTTVIDFSFSPAQIGPTVSWKRGEQKFSRLISNTYYPELIINENGRLFIHSEGTFR